MLVDDLRAKMAAQGKKYLTMELRETNVHGQLFLNHLGFRCIKQVRACYETGEDCYIFQWRVPRAVPA